MYFQVFKLAAHGEQPADRDGHCRPLLLPVHRAGGEAGDAGAPKPNMRAPYRLQHQRAEGAWHATTAAFLSLFLMASRPIYHTRNI